MSIPRWQQEIIERGELHRVGGAVRDAIMRHTTVTQDHDFLVRGIPPDELDALLRRHGKVALVGKSFGVYKFTTPDGTTYDIVYPRKEQSTGPGHRDFDVAWDWELSVEEDLGRRDFTMNAIAQNIADDRIVDPHHGAGDIERGVVRMIFPEAFREDPLRILRGVRFAERFQFSVEPNTQQSMASSAQLLETLTPERVQEEFTKLLQECDRVSGAFERLRDIGALAVLLPELDRCAGVEQNVHHIDDVFVHSLKTADAAPQDNLTVRWAALLHDVGKVDTKQRVQDKLGDRVVFYGHEQVSAEMTERVLTRLRYSNALVANCVHLVAQHMYNYEPDWKPQTVRRFIRRVGEEHLDDLFALREADCRSRDLADELGHLDELRVRVKAEIDAQAAFKITDLAIGGDDVIRECGVSAGPEVGRILSALLDAVLDAPERNTREGLLVLAKEIANEEERA